MENTSLIRSNKLMKYLHFYLNPEVKMKQFVLGLGVVPCSHFNMFVQRKEKIES